MMQITSEKDCLSCRKLLDWCARFKNSRESLKDEFHSELPFTLLIKFGSRPLFPKFKTEWQEDVDTIKWL